MKISILLLGVTVVMSGSVCAQDILAKTIQKISNLNNASYDVCFQNQFYDQLTNDTLHTRLKMIRPQILKDNYYYIKATPFIIHNNGKQEIRIYPADSAYNIDTPLVDQYARSLILYWTIEFARFKKDSDRLIQLPDTLVEGKNYLLLNYIMQKDTVINNHLVYDRVKILINKETYLPFEIESDTKYLINDLPTEWKSNYRYFNYRLNEPKFTDLSVLRIPSGYVSYDEKNKAKKNEEKANPPLSAGMLAPGFNVIDIDSNTISSKDFLNKITLLNFTSIRCPHGFEAIGGLKRIEDHFKSNNFQIIKVYDNSLSDEKSVRTLNEKYNTKGMQSILNGDSLAKVYHSYGFPHFYIIDKQGKIAFYVFGYSKEIESEIVNKLNELTQ